MRKLMVMLRSFYIKYIKGQRYNNSISTCKLYEVYIKDPCWKNRNITYYKNGKKLTRQFKDMNNG